MLDWTPVWPELMANVVVAGPMTRVPLIQRFIMMVVVPVTSNLTVYQFPAARVKLPVATLWKVAVPLSQ